jgi:hypothetical protein
MGSFDAFSELAQSFNATVEKRRSFTITRGRHTVAVRHSPTKNKLFTLTVECATPPLPGIRLRSESALDRFGKRIGLNREIQTGDAVFDKHVYTETYANDETLSRALSVTALRQGALFILQRSSYSDIYLDKKGIRLGKTGTDTSILNPQRFEEMLGTLSMIADALPRFEEWETKVSKITLGGLICVGSIVLTVAVIVLTIVAARQWRTLDWSPWLNGWLIGFVVWLVWIPVCGRLLRGRSDAFRNFIISMIFTSFTLPMLGGAGVVFGNGYYDTSTPVAHKTRVLRKYTSRTKNSTNYNVEVQSWRPQEKGIVFTGNTYYNSKREGGPATVTTGSGAFGYEWIVSYN